MNAEIFYQEFKDALFYLGLSWFRKGEASVRVVGDSFRVEYGGRSISFKVL